MKRKLKGLAAIWLAAIMMLGIFSQNITVQAVTDNIYYYIYTGTEPLQKGGRSCYKERIDIEWDTPLNEQSDIMAYVDVPQGKLLSWRLWGGEEDSGWIYPVTDPVSKEAGEGVSQEECDALLEEALKEDPDIWWRSMIIEPYLLDKCRISQQPAASNAYTVKGEMTEDGTDWQETEDIAYQWYETQVKKKEYRVVDENAVPEEEINCLGVMNGSYEGGFWRPGAYEDFGITISAKAGDVVTFTPKEGVSLWVEISGTADSSPVEQEDGTWTATIEEDGEYAFLIESRDGNIPECTIQAGQTMITETECIESEGFYEGGFWRPGAYDEFGIAFSAAAGDVVTVTPKEGVSLYVDGTLWFEKQEDGTWTATAEEDGECGFYISREDENTPECTIQVERTTATTTLLPNQTTAALTAGENGKQYFCKCTFNPDDIALVVDSDIVTYEHQHVWSDKWTTDGSHHWHECTSANCPLTDNSQKDGYGVHSGGQASYTEPAVCSQCKKQYGDVLADTEAPAGVIQIGKDTWDGLPAAGEAVVDRYYNSSQTVKVEGQDEETGIGSISYYISDRVLTGDEIGDISQWVEYNGSFLLEAEGSCIIYARLTDQADAVIPDHPANTAYLSTDRLVLDTTVPVIEGIADGKVYTGSTEFTVTEQHLKEVTVNGKVIEPSEGVYTLTAGLAQQEVTATDLAGNSVTVTVTVNAAVSPEPDIGIDYRTEELVGFETDGIYEINGKTVVPENGKLPVGNYIGMKDTEISIVRKGDAEHADSEPQVLTVPPYPKAPMEIQTVGETAKGANDGKITGLTDGMEYRVSGAQTWEKLTADVSGTLTGLAPGTYEVRIAATEESFASKKTVVTVAAYEEPKPEPPVKPSGTAPGRPPEVIYVDLSETEKVGDIGLSEQWQWTDQDKERSLGGLDVGDTMKVTAEYTGTDRDSYETVTAETILYIVKGKLQNITNPEGNAFSGNLRMKQSELQNLLLDSEDKTQIEDGEDIYVYLTVDSLEDGEVPLSDKEQAAGKLAELQAEAEKQDEKVTFGAYMDVSLYKRIGNDSPKKVTKTNGMVEVTITIPEKWLNTDASVTRTFYILRVHNGVAELLKCRQGAKAGEYIFETDAFSTYALLYTDKTEDKGTKPPQTTEKPGTSEGGTKPPQTTETPEEKEDHTKEDEAGQTGNQIEKRTDLSLLLATGKQTGKNAIKLNWLKYKDVTGYEVYWSYCDGKKNFKKAKTVLTKGKRTYTHKKLKKNRTYKYFVAAYKTVDGNKYYTAKSPTIHVAMKNEKRTNIKSIKVNKSKITLKKGKTFRIKAKLQLENRKKKPLTHAAKLRYYTDDKTVAVVSKDGKITAKKKGKCNIYVIANNGVSKKIKVTVK